MNFDISYVYIGRCSECPLCILRQHSRATKWWLLATVLSHHVWSMLHPSPRYVKWKHCKLHVVAIAILLSQCVAESYLDVELPQLCSEMGIQPLHCNSLCTVLLFVLSSLANVNVLNWEVSFTGRSIESCCVGVNQSFILPPASWGLCVGLTLSAFLSQSPNPTDDFPSGERRDGICECRCTCFQ